MTTLAEYNGATGDYTIYSSDGKTPLLTGNADMDEYHRINDAIRRAEKLTVARTRNAVDDEMYKLFERWRRG